MDLLWPQHGDAKHKMNHVRDVLQEEIRVEKGKGLTVPFFPSLFSSFALSTQVPESNLSKSRQLLTGPIRAGTLLVLVQE